MRARAVLLACLRRRGGTVVGGEELEEEEVVRRIAGAVSGGRWGKRAEDVVGPLLPLPNARLWRSVLARLEEEEAALGLVSWAASAEGGGLGREEVEAIAEAWAEKYGSEEMASMHQRLLQGEATDVGGTGGVWAALITACTKLGMPAQGVSMFVDLKTKMVGFSPCCLTYEALIFALLKCGKLDAALFAAKDIVANNHLPGPKPLAALLDSLCKSAKIQAALAFIQEIENRAAPDTALLQQLYSRFIVAVWRSPNNSMALEILVEMKNKGLKPDGHAYTACIKLLCRNYRYDAALELVKEMGNDDRCAPDMPTYTALINGLNRGGRVKEALGIAEHVKERGGPLDTRVYTAMLNSLFLAGRVHDAIESFKRMEKEGCLLDVVTYSVMIKNLCKVGHMECALDIKKDMIRKGFQPDVRLYNALVQGLCLGSRYVDELLHLVQEMKSNGFLLPAEVYLTLVTHFCTLGNFDDAQIWAKDMIDQGYEPTPYLRTTFGSQLGDIFGYEGRHHKHESL